MRWVVKTHHLTLLVASSLVLFPHPLASCAHYPYLAWPLLSIPLAWPSIITVSEFSWVKQSSKHSPLSD
jgi:hypothetical protein